MTREEAIRRIKAWNLDSDDREVLAVIIPELAESEDERIRKAIVGLIEELQRSDKYFAGVELTDMLTYLEKQKGIEDRWIEDRGQCFWDGVEEGKMLAEKKKEQKPAEWSEDSVKFEEGFKAGRESGLRDGQKYVLNNLDSYGLCRVGGK